MYGMRKTTVYLPDELKARLETVAEQERLSEAEVIRRAIEQFVDGRARPRPTLPLFERGEIEPIEDWEEAMRGFGED